MGMVRPAATVRCPTMPMAALIARPCRWSRMQNSKLFRKARLRAWTPLRVEERLQSTDIDRPSRIVSDRSGLRGCSASMEWSVSSTAAAIQFQPGLYRKSNLSRLACAMQSDYGTTHDLGPSHRSMERRLSCLFDTIQTIEAGSA